MQSYFGGRAESRVRNWEVPVCPVDFMSQYPTVNELLDNWPVLTAESVTFPDATGEIKQLLSRIDISDCFDRKLWPEFKFVGLVRPDGDVLPVRTVYKTARSKISELITSPAKSGLVCRPGYHRLHFANRESPKHRQSDKGSASWQTGRFRIDIAAGDG